MTDIGFVLLLPGDLDVDRVRAALTELVSVPVETIDIAGHDAADRNWDADVLITYSAAAGDIAWVLDISFSDAVHEPPTDTRTACFLAERLAAPVFFPSELQRPSSYWVAAPGAILTRARFTDPDGLDDADREQDDNRTIYLIDAVEQAIPQLPGIRVDAQPEVIKDYAMATPIADEWEASLTKAGIADDLWVPKDRLGAWESLTVRMATGWPPDGWYPLAYFQDDLRTRDELARIAEKLPTSFRNALTRIDADFRAGTTDTETGDTEPGHACDWWWRRTPDPPPWDRAPWSRTSCNGAPRNRAQ